MNKRNSATLLPQLGALCFTVGAGAQAQTALSPRDLAHELNGRPATIQTSSKLVVSRVRRVNEATGEVATRDQSMPRIACRDIVSIEYESRQRREMRSNRRGMLMAGFVLSTLFLLAADQGAPTVATVVSAPFVVWKGGAKLTPRRLTTVVPRCP